VHDRPEDHGRVGAGDHDATVRAPAGSGGRVGAAGTSGWRVGPRTGVVEAFDEPRGTGVLRGADGVRLPFHCTALVDGSRRVDEGTVVVYVVAPGQRGQMEAIGIRPLAGGPLDGGDRGLSAAVRDPAPGGDGSGPVAEGPGWA